MAWQRALVLGGGAYVGWAWEAGVCAGLFERGVDLRECDAFVGTSAGAMNGACLASGQWPVHAASTGVASSAVMDLSRFDVPALSQILERWSKIERANKADARAIGAIAKDLYRASEADWINSVRAVVGVTEWPAKPLFVIAVDVVSGERKVFDAQSGVPLLPTIAASASIPGVFASVDVGGRRYMDGQVLSSTHADLLLKHPGAERPREVVILMPSNRHTAPKIGPLAEREAAAEVEALKAAGCRVHFVTPEPRHIARLGTNLLDAQRMHDAYAVGVECGGSLAVHLA